MAGADKPSIFLDADVLISGSFSTQGASHLILRLAELGMVDAVSSEQVRRETERNLRAKLPAGLSTFHQVTEATVRWVADPHDAVLERYRGQAHAKDITILAAAVEAKCAVLVTLNVRDYKPKQGSIRVEAPGEFLRRLREALLRATE